LTEIHTVTHEIDMVQYALNPTVANICIMIIPQMSALKTAWIMHSWRKCQTHLKLFITQSAISCCEINESLLVSMRWRSTASRCLASCADNFENSSFTSCDPNSIHRSQESFHITRANMHCITAFCLHIQRPKQNHTNNFKIWMTWKWSFIFQVS